MKLNRFLALTTLFLALAACGGDDMDTEDVIDDTDDSGGGGGTPTLSVDAGPDIVTATGLVTQINAVVTEGSNAATISWTQTAGTSVTLSSADTATPSFTAPTVTEETSLTFEVTVDDGVNAALTDTVDVAIFVPTAYSDALTEIADFSAKDGWICNQSAGTSEVTISTSGSFRTVDSNSLPSHSIGTFPNDGNPNTAGATSQNYSVTTSPVKTTSSTDMAIFGFLLNGVLLERDTAERYPSGSWSYEAVTPGLEMGNSKGTDTNSALSENWLGTDCNNSHVQPTGKYHVHGFPESYFRQLEKDSDPDQMILAGYAADGFPIYLRYGYNDPDDASSGIFKISHSWRLISGTRPDGPGGAYDGTFRQDWEYVEGLGDTDQCGGRFGVTPEHPDGIYHYYITDNYPYIPRCVFGTPSSDFRTLRN